MVGLSDIPCVGVAVQRFSEDVVDAMTRGLRYSLCYKTVVNQLNSEIEKVKTEEVRVSRKVDAAKNHGEIIDERVLKWQQDVVNTKSLAEGLSGQTTSCTCFKVLRIPNLVSRFRLGRKAAHQSKNVADLTVSGGELVANEVGYLPPAENLPISNTTYQDFVSREVAYGKLWEALVNENGDSVIGIYGMPGVGKTRMMEQAWVDAKAKNIFEKVARVNVSEKFDVIGLQKKLAASLKCDLESEDNEQERASQLKRSLMNGGKTMVVLDDVWDVIPLSSIGIPFADGSSKGCKILLTSRKKDICLRNNCQYPIEIQTLTDGEAWKMFQSRVGGSSEIGKLNDASLAVEVCKRCAGLPLAIDAVGNALKCATENIWKDALRRLENHKFKEIKGINTQVSAIIELSFEMLDVEARTCLFLCSLFGEDEDIEIHFLLNLATGCHLLDREVNIFAVIDILKSSSLLLHDEDQETVKLHDVIRDVARSVAESDPEYAFLSVRCGSWLPDNIDNRTPRLLQLELEEDNFRLPDEMVFPDLQTLWLRGNRMSEQLSSGFFERFSNLKFLVVQFMSFTDQEQISIRGLKKLKMVTLQKCTIEEMFVSSISESLQTLFIQNCRLPDTLKLPVLKDLRKLVLFDNYELNLEKKTISGFSSLEELNILDGFTIGDKAGGSSIFSEVSELRRLKNLMINLQVCDSFPDEDTVNRLVKFDISAGYGLTRSGVYSKNAIRLYQIGIENGWIALVNRAEVVELHKVSSLAKVFSDRNMREPNLTEGRNKQLPSTTPFSNLTIIKIFECSGSKYLFSATAAKCLKQLQQLDVQFCYEIEEIIRSEGGITAEGEVICFPNLKKLNLYGLPRLTNFSSHKVAFPKMQDMRMWDLNSCFSLQKIELGLYDSPPTLNTLSVTFHGQEVSELPLQWLHQLQNIEYLRLSNCWWTGDSIFNGTLFSGRLKSLHIWECGVTSLFRYSSLASFQQLEVLLLSNCPLLEGIAWGDEPDLFNNGDKTTILLPRLQKITLVNLPELKNCGIFSCSMPTLERVTIDHCGFSTLFTSSTFKSLKKLSFLKVSGCPVLENILEDEMHDQTPKDTISLLCLESITLDSLISLKSFSRSSIHAFDMPVLKEVQMNDCPRMHTFSLGEVIMPGVKVQTLHRSYSNVSDLNRYVREEVYGREKKSKAGRHQGTRRK